MKIDGLYSPDAEAQMARDCIQALQLTVNDPKTPATARAQASRTLLEALGVVGGQGKSVPPPPRQVAAARRSNGAPPGPEEPPADAAELRKMLKDLGAVRVRLEEAGAHLRANGLPSAVPDSPIDL
jgi:hypothetical protein